MVLNETKYKDTWVDAEGYYKVRNGERMDNRYDVYATGVGKGVFSNVVRARDTLDDNLQVAIKIIRNNELMYKAGLKELEIIKALNLADKKMSHFCVKFKRHFMHKDHLCMVFENCSMNLRDVTKKFGREDGEVVGIALNAVQRYAYQLLMSLKLMHKCGVIHADIKPDNILVVEDKSKCVLCDFGSAMYIREVVPTPMLVSRFYRAPEIMTGHHYSYGIDMWAVATTLFELATGQILFNERDNNAMLRAIQELKGKATNKFIRKGVPEIRDQHFDIDNNFVSIEIDKQTKKPFMRTLESINSSPDFLMRALRKVNKHPEDLRKVQQFKDLLDKMLVLDPERRITPKEALSHPFITEK